MRTLEYEKESYTRRCARARADPTMAEARLDERAKAIYHWLQFPEQPAIPQYLENAPAH